MFITNNCQLTNDPSCVQLFEVCENCSLNKLRQFRILEVPWTIESIPWPFVETEFNKVNRHAIFFTIPFASAFS